MASIIISWHPLKVACRDGDFPCMLKFLSSRCYFKITNPFWNLDSQEIKNTSGHSVPHFRSALQGTLLLWLLRTSCLRWNNNIF